MHGNVAVRRRKLKARHPRDANVPTPSAIRNTITRALRAAADPKLETLLGRLHDGRLLSDQQYEAGLRFGRLAREYARVLASPRRAARSVSLERCAGRGIEMAEDPARTLATRHTFEQARQRLVAVRAFPVVVATVVDDQPGDIEVLRKGLHELTAFFRL